MTVTDLVRSRAAAAGYPTVQALFEGLQPALPGLTYATVHHWWSGKHRPSRTMAMALGDLLELSAADRAALHELPLPEAPIPPFEAIPS